MSTPSSGRRSNRFRARSLEVAALGLAASSVPDVASAAIIYDLSLANSPASTFSVDGTVAGEIDLISNIGGMGGLELILEAPTGMGTGSTLELSVFSGGGMNPPDFLSFLNPGDTVDGSLTYATEAFMVEGGVTNPAWTPGVTGYAGFVFDDGSGIPLYGWLEIEFAASGTDFTVLGFAYDDSGATIAAAAIPEPSTLLLVGLGLAGLSIKFGKRFRPRIAPSPN
jgi:hypothetical protein